ncbi:class I SAM-dependent methyltransferase [Stieleria magnilauensis]|uniref:Methyltransferase YcgJ n=1 Tax=Stieleria magnilauensis TaxID=2527963 RepID=A0ABX5XM81_9BACT|nr:putative methyltransferase YcgJ [Planctomycetes bacterium TBK1r]
MLNPLQVFPIVLGQAFVPQTLKRTPEVFDETAVMSAEESVQQYNEAMESKLVIIYAAVLEHIHRVRRKTEGGRAIDLCCGPGHFTLLMAKHFDFEEVVGVDLSEPMVAAANRNADSWGLSDRVRFEVGDATAVQAPDGAFDVVTCNDAAHHMPNLQLVGELLGEMDRLSPHDGIAVLSDLVRLKTDSLTQRYTKLIGQDYLDRGLDSFQQDFCNSMQAAWTGDELRLAVPSRSNKAWHHTIQKLLPTVQLITAYPNDGNPIQIRKSLPWSDHDHPVPSHMKTDWNLFRVLLA